MPEAPCTQLIEHALLGDHPSSVVEGLGPVEMHNFGVRVVGVVGFRIEFLAQLLLPDLALVKLADGTLVQWTVLCRRVRACVVKRVQGGVTVSLWVEREADRLVSSMLSMFTCSREKGLALTPKMEPIVLGEDPAQELGVGLLEVGKVEQHNASIVRVLVGLQNIQANVKWVEREVDHNTQLDGR